MKSKKMLTIPAIAVLFAVMGSWAILAQDKYTLKVPGGLAFSGSKDTSPGSSSPSARMDPSLPRSWGIQR